MLKTAGALFEKTVRGGTRITPSKLVVKVAGPSATDIDECELIPSQRCSAGISNGKGFPSVTMIQGCMDSKKELLKWQQDKIAEMGQTLFRKMCTDRTAAGSRFHSRVENLLALAEKKNMPNKEAGFRDVPESIEGYLESVYPYLESLQIESGSLLIERPVVHWKLQYRGKFDALFSIDGKLCLFEWKTSLPHSAVARNSAISLSSSGLYGYPRQLAAYVAAINSDPQYLVQVRHATIVIATNDGAPARIIEIDPVELEKHWLDFKDQLKGFWHAIQNTPGEVNFIENDYLGEKYAEVAPPADPPGPVFIVVYHRDKLTHVILYHKIMQIWYS